MKATHDGNPRELTVLIVDDNLAVRDSMAEYLESWGFKITTAKDGEEAVNRALTERPAVIMMDLDMPVLDGWEATRRLRSRPQTAGIPVVVVSAYSHPQARELAFTVGCVEMLTKPVNPKLVAERLRYHAEHPPSTQA